MPATAAATASTAKQPNFLDLSGAIKVSYSSTSFGGQPLFHYEDGKVKKDFVGGDIRKEESELGAS